MDSFFRFFKQERNVIGLVVLALLVVAGAGCTWIKVASPISGMQVSPEELGADAVVFEREAHIRLGEITAEIQSLELRYDALIGDHELVAQAFGDAYDRMEEKRQGFAGMWSKSFELLSGLPGPLQPAVMLLGGLGTALLGNEVRRKELVIRKLNRNSNRGPRGERLPE